MAHRSQRIAWSLLALLMAASRSGAALPTELAGMETLADDETRFLAAVRNYDLIERPLAEWDMSMAQSHGGAGDEALANAKIQEATHRIALVRAAYEEFLARYPKNAQALAYYGELLYDVPGDVAGAVRAWKLAAAIDRNLGRPINDLAIHYCHCGEYKAGFRYFERLLKMEPSNPDYLFNVAQAYLIHYPEVQKEYRWDKKTVYRKAMAFSEKAARLAPDDYEILQDYAVNFFAGEPNFGVEVDWRRAAEAWQKARPYAPQKENVFFTWLNEARAWSKTGRKDKAAECLREALRILPDNDTAQKLLAEAEGRATPDKQTP